MSSETRKGRRGNSSDTHATTTARDDEGTLVTNNKSRNRGEGIHLNCRVYCYKSLIRSPKTAAPTETSRKKKHEEELGLSRRGSPRLERAHNKADNNNVLALPAHTHPPTHPPTHAPTVHAQACNMLSITFFGELYIVGSTDVPLHTCHHIE